MNKNKWGFAVKPKKYAPLMLVQTALPLLYLRMKFLKQLVRLILKVTQIMKKLWMHVIKLNHF